MQFRQRKFGNNQAAADYDNRIIAILKESFLDLTLLVL